MIKNEMNFPLSIDTDTLKSTGSVMMTATDAELFPYSIGYVPYELIEKSTVFKRFSRGLASSIPNTLFMYSPEVVGEAQKGIPFVYTVKSGTENSHTNIFYNGSAWGQLPFGNNNADMRILHSFDTDYYVNRDIDFGTTINSIGLHFRYIECAYNEQGWQGDLIYSVKMPNYFSVNATITPTPNIALTFSQTINSSYNNHVYTIDQTIFDNMYENGLCELDGGKYTENGTEYGVKLYLFIEYVDINNTYVSGDLPGNGVMCIDNVRFGGGWNSSATYFQLEYGTSRQNQWLLGSKEVFVENFPSAYGYFIKTSSTDVSIFRSAITAWINMAVSGGFKFNDIIVLICTAFPVYKIGDAYYVAEFDDDYVITGKLIPYEDAREWQTFINPDANKFDYNDIPEPDPEGPGEEPDEGDRGAAIDKWNWSLKPGLGYFINYGVFSEAGLTELAMQLWNKPDGFFKKIVASTSNDFMEYFVSLKYFPLAIDGATPIQNLYFGRGGHFVISNNYYVPNPVQSFNFGEVVIKRQYNNFLDYSPYTRIGIYLPYSGTWELNPTEVMGSRISLNLLVDIVDGSGIWLVYNERYEQPVLIKQCKISVDFPLTSLNSSQMASNQINAILQGVQTTSNSVTAGVNTSLGAIGSGTGGGGASGELGMAASGMKVIQAGVNNSLAFAGSWLNIAQASKEIPQYSGASSGAVATVVNHTPYITYQRPLCQNPENYNHVYGRIINSTDYIKNRTGFTSCNNVDVSSIGQAVDKEKAQIKRILESGFYV